ncbi:MAG: hypothetical protein ACSLE5_15350 [Porticoccaceae bacterium]
MQKPKEARAMIDCRKCGEAQAALTDRADRIQCGYTRHMREPKLTTDSALMLAIEQHLCIIAVAGDYCREHDGRSR